MKELTQLTEWRALKEHHQSIAHHHMQSWFDENPLRFEQFSLQKGGLLFDYSKNRISQKTLSLLSQLAHAVQLPEKIAELFDGKLCNSTERRPALHTVLRRRLRDAFYLNEKNITQDIDNALTKMGIFATQIHTGAWLGATGKPIKDIVNIGIGGSHLGPLMATHALSDFAIHGLNCYFISNIDPSHLNDVFNQIDPETSLFIISSKSFTTLETLTNAKTIRAWLQKKLNINDVSRHFVAVTAAQNKALEFGIPEEQIFPLWNWVGGRYSVWSAIGLPLALMIGMEHFLEFLDGAYDIDEHFHQTDFDKNIPVIMALLGIWYINFFNAQSHAVIPYSHLLNYFRPHLQQLDMESNGKRVTHYGEVINYATGPIIWGEQGCNGQHAFHQLLHQGQHFIPVDFILVGNQIADHHQDILVASALSQAKALMFGKSFAEALQECHAEGHEKTDAEYLALHRSLPGNRPSNILFLNTMTPRNLGALLALYEHKIFVQGAIWGINSFDQWGVELGKQMLPQILNDLTNPTPRAEHDTSTMGLINFYKNIEKK